MLKRFICAIAMLILTLNIVPAQSAKQDKDKKDAQATQPRQSAAATGSGTKGRITRWLNSTTLGDSNITEDKSGNIGIGTTLPKSPLTVEGIIETTGGIKFPDGTIQSTASGVITHDNTLTGNGTPALPLGLAVPLNLLGSVGGLNGVITVQNTASFGIGILVHGSRDGTGLVSFGGSADQVRGGTGIQGTGGVGDQVQGGIGVQGTGGFSFDVQGGEGGIFAGGGSNQEGGKGLIVVGGNASTFGGTGILAFAGNGAIPGKAGVFAGNVDVTGTLTKGGGSFKIDHPLDPENKYLSHSFVESPDMMNIYNGVIVLDAKGEAVVEMPEWFSALNRDFRYLLTPVGAPMPGLFIAEEMANNHFKISGGAAGMKVSWQVTGIRQDAWANKNRIPVEEIKPESERGLYLHPDAFNKPEERAIESVRRPEIKQHRQAEQTRNKQK